MLNSNNKWMNLAILEAFRAKGASGKNPPVGCIIVKDNQIISRGRTSLSGRPHAEQNAINKIKDKKKLLNSFMFITLEPCAHKNISGISCAELISKTGISKVFISCEDLDPRTSGKGITILKNNNIEVFENFMNLNSIFLYEGFFSKVINKKPYITLKIACSLDGKIALNNNVSKWITNDLSRSYSHFIRSQNDAILTTSSTVLADNPELTCRLNGMEDRSPTKVLLDRYLKVSKNHKIFDCNYNQELIIYFLYEKLKPIDDQNLEKVSYVGINSNFDNNLKYFNFIFNDLALRGINNLLIECGSVMNSFLLSLNLIDQLIIFRSSKIIGNDGMPFVNSLGFQNINELINYKLISMRAFEDDVLEVRKLN
ncbi:MAG: bifunctional diaminohydroxyphosphoribosylaminopyrimidine deaminase/5-amino-6-(5-phosphoribosylamino)uracil reductase RibD [Proteobacteria bacterium]|nr:bifunctional diaminohydroxyphosphoribosylaminopyrimidine deaminase/5-amino-6-(5-phosphoribosylamino)uracil reductase RibD [Pseudomonadota bacterium]MDA1136313.1 bifunctional diaminohydroxyphosphoribosylaminopyrimidine deaminase/5-amino-6-(5-phosphoribosylamino)uracil reductase RibD [Pseudomonadota bacterium]